MSPETFPVPRAPARAAWAATVPLLCTLVALLAGGCESDALPQSERPIAGSRLAIYASAPLHGPDREAGEAIFRAQRLALAQDGGRVGRYQVRLVTLDAARPFTGGADPAKVSLNARRAARDPHAVAYLGEVRTGASAVSIPILNEAGMLQVSPLDTALGLTTHTMAITGSPVRYYPNAKRAGRTFARLVPSDGVQADALLAFMQQEGLRRAALLTDEDAPGQALAAAVRDAVRDHGVTIVASEQVDAHAEEHRELVADVLARRPDAVLYAGAMRDVAARIWRELARADSDLKLFAPNALASPSFAVWAGAAGAGAYAARPLLPLGAYQPAARPFARAFADRYGARPTPAALYGYESMRVTLAAIRSAERASGDGRIARDDVVGAFFEGGRHDGVLGPYRIDGHGDTSLRRYALYRVGAGELWYAGEFEPSTK